MTGLDRADQWVAPPSGRWPGTPARSSRRRTRRGRRPRSASTALGAEGALAAPRSYVGLVVWPTSAVRANDLDAQLSIIQRTATEVSSPPE